MRADDRAGYAERLHTAAEARKTQLANFRPRPAVSSPEPPDRASLKAVELTRVRQQRAAVRTARRESLAEAERQAGLAAAAREGAALDAARAERKERKALTKVEAKARRDARYAARKARK